MPKKNSVFSDPLIEEIYTDKDFEPTTKHIVALYKAIISTIEGLGVNENNYICSDNGDSLIPMQLNDKAFVLPSRENLKREDNDDLQFFHPLSENPMRGESLIISTLLKYLTINVNTSLAVMILRMGEIISNPDNIEKLSVPQLELAKKIGFKDANFLKYVKKVRSELMNAVVNKEYPISFFLKPKALINDKTYGRGCIVNMDLDNLYDEDEGTFFGVKQPSVKKAYAAHMMNMINVLIPGHDEVNKYSYGTYPKVAPYFCCLIGGWVNVRKAFNEVLAPFAKDEVFDEVITDLSWCGGNPPDMEKFEDVLETMVGIIPNLDGNIGSGGATKDTASKADKSKLMNQFLEEANSNMPNREEGSSEQPTTRTEPQPQAKGNDDSSYGGLNPALLGGGEKKEQPPWNQPQQNNGWHQNNNGWNQQNTNQWNQPQQNNGWGQPQGNNWNNSGGWNNSYQDNRSGVPTQSVRETLNSDYNGPKF